MATLTAQRFSLPLLGLLAALLIGLFMLVSSALIPTEGLLFTWIGIGSLVLFLFYAVQGSLLIAIALWLVTLIALHEEFWRMPVPFFFAVTIPRIGIVVLVALLVAMLALGRIRIRHAWPASGLLAAVAVYFFLSAVVSGFQTRSVVSVHYRLIGGYIFPFAVFALILHAFNHERDFKRLAIFFSIIGAYLTFTGWCEQFGIAALVFPKFINDPGVGIHWGRVRGPFVMSAAMGLALIYCYFNNLVLARNIRRGRWLLYALNAAMLPTIFWTETRSVWLSFVFCMLIWAAYSRRRTSRVVSVSVLLALVLLVAVVNMDNFISAERAKGGLTDIEPILLRIGLAQMSWEILIEHPLFGVGFGHFRDFAPGFAKDPSSPFYAFGTTALEHNNLLSIVAETGVIGVTLYLLMLYFLLRFSVRLFKKLPARSPGLISRDLLVLYWILTAAYLIDGTFRETSDNPFANSLFFGLSAVPVALEVLLGPSPIRRSVGFPPIGPTSRPTVPFYPGSGGGAGAGSLTTRFASRPGPAQPRGRSPSRAAPPLGRPHAAGGDA